MNAVWLYHCAYRCPHYEAPLIKPPLSIQGILFCSSNLGNVALNQTAFRGANLATSHNFFCRAWGPRSKKCRLTVFADGNGTIGASRKELCLTVTSVTMCNDKTDSAKQKCVLLTQARWTSNNLTSAFQVLMLDETVWCIGSVLAWQSQQVWNDFRLCNKESIFLMWLLADHSSG